MISSEEFSKRIEVSLLSIDRIEINELLGQINKIYNSYQIIDEIIVPTLQHIGEMWEDGSIALSQVYMSARICEELLDKIIPFDKRSVQNHGKVGLAVLEDYHGLGKKLLKKFLLTSGIEVIDYDVGIEVDELIKKVKKDKIEIIFISTLMLRAALRIKDFKKRLESEGYQIKIVVGGAPFLFDSQLWKFVEADAMGRNVFDAINIINKFNGS